MILGLEGSLNVLSCYVNMITIAAFLGMSTDNTKRVAENSVVKAIFLFTFSYSIVPKKLPCLIATLLFFIFEVKNFISNRIEYVKNTIE